MIAALIRWSARNVFLVGLATIFVTLAGFYAVVAGTARCHSRPLRRSGHCLHRVSWPSAASGRGSGHLSADHGNAHCAAVKSGARLLVLRGLVRLRHLRGWDRHLLGALRVLEYLNAAARRLPAGVTPASDRTPPASVGSTNTSYAERRRTSPNCAPSRTGMSALGLPRLKAWPRSPSVGGFVKQYSVVIDPRRLQALGIPLSRFAMSSARATWMLAAARSRSPRLNSPCVAAAISGIVGPRANRGQERRRRAGTP